MPIVIAAHGSSTAAGATPELVAALWQRRSFRDEDGLCRWSDRGRGGAQADLQSHLQQAWGELQAQYSGTVGEKRLGVILASTKGILDDIVHTPGPALEADPLWPVLDEFLNAADLKPARRLCISNACASSHSAIYVASKWLGLDLVDEVLVLAADRIGPFVKSGFTALGALSPTGARPFSRDRDGLQLGDGAAALLLTRADTGEFILEAIEIETEGTSITRPSSSGAGLLALCRKAVGENPVDAILAHGTGTLANDSVEDRVFGELFEQRLPLTSATKGCVGHTLGASGAIDVIAALTVLRRGEMFPLTTTTEIDPAFGARYALPGRDLAIAGRRALVTSLGFGGIHGVAVIRREAR